MSACVPSGFLQQSEDMHVGLISNSKLTIGVNVGVNGLLSVCVSPAMDPRPVQDVLYLSPSVCWDGVQLLVTLNRIRGLDDRWMDDLDVRDGLRITCIFRAVRAKILEGEAPHLLK